MAETAKETGAYLEATRRRIDRYLKKSLPRAGAAPPRFLQAIDYAVFSGGKRVRPILLLYTNRLCGGRTEKALPAAAAVELIHTFSLIQDDLPSMDNDDLRRGKPTLHRAFEEYAALLASDYLLIRAFELLARHYPPEAALVKPIDRRRLTEIRKKKTAALFELVFRLGALTAGRIRMADDWAEYGRDFGLAFQLWDDLADEKKIEPAERMVRQLRRLNRELEKRQARLAPEAPVLDYFRNFLLQGAGPDR
ncbi:MAG: Farnesyl diphosphate synthase [candidate division TA06 bacterium ADurb.Bin417]|uniref:Farnesyl diphosphate synthase n=1 Tax=candidate division TA06 bacterium ADurb.Bin417 TaxID=1852828 RepID=A0A1V5MJZ3_UNCT6|nr:MAG: Farnesyl diphosphate synthase [candidate division TA06 bacterium ADurb.Bin417]